MGPQVSQSPRLLHVHHCSSCGRHVRPEKFSSRDTMRGIFECLFCHHTEPLNVQIVSMTLIEEES
jgi:hypothetical protein